MPAHIDLQKITHCPKCGKELKVTNETQIAVTKKCSDCDFVVVVPIIPSYICCS